MQRELGKHTVSPPTAPPAETLPASIIFVVVHGIGDQVRCQAMQDLIQRFTSYLGDKASVPLGRLASQNSFSLYEHSSAVSPVAAVGEVYWADIPRAVVKEGYTLEETCQWARLLVDKLDRANGECLSPPDRQAIKRILPEAIQTIDVLQRLFRLAEWAGTLKLDLKWLLDNFLGDVQLVTEFAHARGEILGRFQDTMQKAYSYNTNASIYLIAHSEGSVLSFLGLLKGLNSGAPWVKSVKGFMTIGSPIDKHLMIWPELWDDLKPVRLDGVDIPWCNYSGRGDPVGYELDTAKKWLGKNSSLRFVKDETFSRYLFPGKAHVDYWHDDAVFGHFFSTVGIKGEKTRNMTDGWWTKSVSGLLPYLTAFVILGIGVFFLYHSVSVCIGHVDGVAALILNVLALTLFMSGIAVSGRVARLVRDLRHHALAWAISCVCWTGFYFLLPDDTCYWLAETITARADPKSTLLLFGFCVSLLGYLAPLIFISSGVTFFSLLGALSAVGLSVVGVLSGPHGNLIPVAVAAAFFTYLWWLAIILFDLTFIWNQYVRRNSAMAIMRLCAANSYIPPFISKRVAVGRR